LRWLGEGFVSLAFPPFCLLCRARTTKLKILCSSCEEQLPALEGARCQQCRDLLEDPDVDLCRACGTQNRGFDLVRCLGPYAGGWSSLLQALKFGRERAVARFLAERLAAYLDTVGPFGQVEAITYVPMSRRDRHRRGFNQAQLLADGLGRRVGIPVLKTLAKVRVTEPQAALRAPQRRRNLRGAFRLIRSGTERVLLVDDIYTTGSTVQECSLTLKSGGYRAVYVLTVARA